MKLPSRLAQGLFVLAMVVASLVMTPGAHATTDPLNKPYTSVQLFKWNWNDIATECTQFLGPQGYGGVQISPPQAAAKITGQWYGMYQPVNYTVLTSEMGTQTDLQNMINTCHAAGVRVYVDMVTNQMAGGTGAATDSTDGLSSWNSTTLTYPGFTSSDFHSSCAINATDYNGTTLPGANGSTSALQSTWDVQNCWLDGMPDLATDNSDVQTKIEAYLNLLIGMKVDGFRIDAAKHQQEAALATIFQALPSTTYEGETLFVTQEIVPDVEVNRASYEALGTINEFQFTYAMRDAFRQNNGQSLATIPIMMGTPGNWGGSSGFLPSDSAQIFVDDWDTERNAPTSSAPLATDSLDASNFYSNNGTSVQNDSSTFTYDLANIFMLAQPYGAMAQVQSGFRFTDVNADRPSTSPFVNGVAQVPTSYTTPTTGWDFIHRRTDIANMVAFRAATNGQTESNRVIGTNNQLAFSLGNVGFVALNNDTTAWQQTFQTGLPAGTYCNVVNGTWSKLDSQCETGTVKTDTVTVYADGSAVLNIPANGGSVVPAVAIYTGQQATAGTSTYSAMFLRGSVSAAGWTPGDSMTLVSNNTWQITETLTAGTAYIYKYDASDNWATGEEWGLDPSGSTASTTSGTAVVSTTTVNPGNLNFTPTTSGVYVFSFNDSTLAYTITPAPAATAPSGSYSTMWLRGSVSANSWTPGDSMTLVSNDTWQITETLTAGTGYIYKYDASDNWVNGEEWGLDPSGSTASTASGTAVVGTATVNPGNLNFTPTTSGEYVFTFNDVTLAYTVTPSTAPVVVPDVPTGLSDSAVTATTLTLNWAASSGATSYNVYRSTSATGTFTAVSGSPVTTNSYADTGLTASTTYYYEVAAVNSAGTSANSAAFSATTSAASAYSSPYAAMYVRGTMSATQWDTSMPMTLVANDTWQITVTLTPGGSYSFKFDTGSWTVGQNWGGGGGFASTSGGNIAFTAGTASMYTITFNDSTLVYSVVPATLPSFTVAVAPTVLFVTVGSNATTTITLTPVNGLDPTDTLKTLQLSCPGLPTGVTCSFSTPTVDASGNIESTMTVSASTSANAIGSLRMKSHPFLPGSALALAVCFMGWKKRRSVLPVLLAVLCLFGLALFTGCGGNGARPITPAISYLTLQATASPSGWPAVKQTATFTIAVQQQ